MRSRIRFPLAHDNAPPQDRFGHSTNHALQTLVSMAHCHIALVVPTDKPESLRAQFGYRDGGVTYQQYLLVRRAELTECVPESVRLETVLDFIDERDYWRTNYLALDRKAEQATASHAECGRRDPVPLPKSKRPRTNVEIARV